MTRLGSPLCRSRSGGCQVNEPYKRRYGLSNRGLVFSA